MDFIRKALLTSFFGPKGESRSIPELEALLEERLKSLPENLNVDTRAFIKAVQEIERQEEIRAYSCSKLYRRWKANLKP